MANKNLFYKVWGMPIILGIVTLLGLISAIMGTGVWHWFSWLALAWPIYIMLRYGLKAAK